MKSVESLPPLTLSALELQPEAGFLAQSMCIHPKASLSHRNRDCLLHEVPHRILLATPGEVPGVLLSKAIGSLQFEVHRRSKDTNTPSHAEDLICPLPFAELHGYSNQLP